MFDAEELTVLENTEEARSDYGYRWGASTIILSKDNILELFRGECLAETDGEYPTFILLKQDDLTEG